MKLSEVPDTPGDQPAQRLKLSQVGETAKEEGGSALGALWRSFLTGTGDIIRGGAQIGARMGPEAPQFAQPGDRESLIRRVDTETQQREQQYQADPRTQAHPIASAIGRIGGNVATTLPMAAIPAGGATMPARLGVSALTGAVAAPLTQPVTGGNFGAEKMKQAGAGLVGGAAGAALGEVVGSTLGRAIAGNNPAAVDALTTRAYRRTVKPSRSGQQSAPALASQDQRILSAVDNIIAEKPNLTLTDPSGTQVTGQLPRTLRQFSEAIDQTKRTLFREYSQMSQQAGVQGAMVDLMPTVQAMRAAAARPEVGHLHPNVAAELNRLADTFEHVRAYTPEEAQDVIQNLNRTIASFYNNPTEEIISGASALGNITPTLRASLDQAIETFQGPGYQMLRNRYGALRSIEKDVAVSVQREANKIPGGVAGTFSNIAASEEALRGVFTFNLAALGRAGAIKAAQVAVKHINGPNRAISRLFEKRAASMQPRNSTLQMIGQGIRGYTPGVGAVGGAMTGADRVRAQRKVSEIQGNLHNAKRKGDMASVQDLTRDLAEAQAEYRKAAPLVA